MKSHYMIIKRYELIIFLNVLHMQKTCHWNIKFIFF
jgi:hypothetical protein